MSAKGTRRSLVIVGPLLTDGEAYPSGRVTVVDGRIVAVQPNAATADADLVVDDGWLIPGLIDLQVNGAAGIDLTTAPDPAEALTIVARTLASHGVTAFCPTVVSASRQTILSRLAAFGPCTPVGGAESLGAHLEGPFLHPDYRGAHDLAALRPPSHDEIQTWLQVSRPAIVTLAPELPGALDAIGDLTAAGIAVGLGHSGADAALAYRALAAGARLGTHLFNAMPPLHHRRPGLVGALLTSAATLGLIADGVHVNPIVVDLVVRAAGVARVALVSDAVAVAAMPPGEHQVGGETVVSDGQAVRRGDGMLVGSAKLLDGGLRNALTWLTWLPPARVIQMATQTPAQVLGPAVAARKGRIAPGYDADLAVLASDWRIVTTIVRGEVVWQASTRSTTVAGCRTGASS